MARNIRCVQSLQVQLLRISPARSIEVRSRIGIMAEDSCKSCIQIQIRLSTYK